MAQQLIDKGVTLALAESCTGGLIGHLLTNVPGSSAFLNRGYVVYSNQAKMEDLGVSEATLERYGAVSEECAREMAEGARSRARTDLALAVTGIAGPGGGTDAKPVGLVYISLASAGDTIVQRHLWKGTRTGQEQDCPHGIAPALASKRDLESPAEGGCTCSSLPGTGVGIYRSFSFSSA